MCTIYSIITNVISNASVISTLSRTCDLPTTVRPDGNIILGAELEGNIRNPVKMNFTLDEIQASLSTFQ